MLIVASQPIIDDDAQCTDFVHALDALLRLRKLNSFPSVTA